MGLLYGIIDSRARFCAIQLTEVIAQPQRGQREPRVDAQVVPQFEQVQQP